MGKQKLSPLKSFFAFWLQSILHSYSQIFFSLKYILAVTILLVTFFSPYIGMVGFCAVLLTNIFAYVVGYNRDEIRYGIYGFNALFLGLVLGYEFQFSFSFVLLFLTAIIILLMITTLLNGYFSKLRLPFLSFPFLITYWIVTLAASNLSQIHLDENHIYTINEVARQQTSIVYYIAHLADNIRVNSFVLIYFKTLAGTFFQDSVLGGMLIAAALLLFSRIAFSLSILGFASAYFFFSLFGANVNELNYHLLGSNFIFLSIAIGCFYIVPNKYSYLTVVILMPVLMLILIFFGKVMSVFQLKAYTLSFSVLCISFLYSLNQRWVQKFLHIVTVQYYSAEKTIYKYLSSVKRFKDAHLAKIALPFWGDWFVSQGYNGKYTHLGNWSQALDFVIADPQNKTYKEPGIIKEDYFCYGKPVLAPLDGYVFEIVNTVEDNDIADVNTEKNWGNTIVMNHLNGLFSQISHIKKDSFKVSVGEYVTRGTVIAACGNSGRSPEPHIHFQLQASPEVGSKTIEYPVAYFIQKNENKEELKIFSIPDESSVISNVGISALLKEAFTFIPGKKISFTNLKNKSTCYWEVFTDAWNRSYIYCAESRSYAYFVNDGTMFYFTDFEGDKRSLLFNFYLAAYRQLQGYYNQICIKDNVPVIHFNSKWIQWIQDFIAPFYLFSKADYFSEFVSADDVNAPKTIKVRSGIETKFFNRTFRKIDFELDFKDNRIETFSIHHKGKSSKYICVS